MCILLRLQTTNRDKSKCEKFPHSYYDNAPTVPYIMYPDDFILLSVSAVD